MLCRLLGLIGVSALLVAAPFGTAKAAEMPVKAPPAPAPQPYTWTGPYVGGNFGGAFTNNVTWCTDGVWANCETAPVDVFNHSLSGVVGGGQVGFRWEFPSSWVIGIEGMFDGLDMSSNELSCVSVAPSCIPGHVNANSNRTVTFEDLFSVTGQIGYAWDRLLLYGKGGIAWTQVELGAVNLPTRNNFSVDDTLTGATGGIGLEWLATRNVSIGIEYDVYGFWDNNMNNSTATGICEFCNFNNNNNNLFIQTVTARLNWRWDVFNPAPIETRD
ncbi:MAG TPA: outer membrane beta-barrel protein [Xanthobacteraceae bacterium]|nr:outer membrane beta-barrel protein [Xanthobacteraceae bacterium]